MKYFRKIFLISHFAVSLMFVACGLALIGFAAVQLWEGVYFLGDAPSLQRLQAVLEGIALLTVAVAALELGETVLEEEVMRGGDMSAPTRVRRFMSRFLLVLVVALAIETLVLVFRFSHERPEHLPYAAAVGAMAAALLAAWGLFIWLNRAAEELEPEALEKTKQEEEKANHDDSA